MKEKKKPPVWKSLQETVKEIKRKDPVFFQRIKESHEQILVAQQIKALRKRLALTQKQVAERANTTQACIARIEQGLALPKLELLSRIVASLGATLKLEIVNPQKDKEHPVPERRGRTQTPTKHAKVPSLVA